MDIRSGLSTRRIIIPIVDTKQKPNANILRRIMWMPTLFIAIVLINMAFLFLIWTHCG